MKILMILKKNMTRLRARMREKMFEFV